VGKNVTLQVVCNHCRAPYDIEVKASDLKDWKEGKGFVQECFPYLSTDDRELLISKTCGVCWDNLFPEPEEEEEMEHHPIELHPTFKDILDSVLGGKKHDN